MKKVLTLVLTFATVLSLVVSASASNYVSSVVQYEAPPHFGHFDEGCRWESPGSHV